MEDEMAAHFRYRKGQLPREPRDLIAGRDADALSAAVVLPFVQRTVDLSACHPPAREVSAHVRASRIEDSRLATRVAKADILSRTQIQ